MAIFVGLSLRMIIQACWQMTLILKHYFYWASYCYLFIN